MARPIQVGDEVVAKADWIADKLAELYGKKARQPFVVESVVRGTGRYACSGGGVMAWRSHLRRVRTVRQIARDAAAKATP